MKRFSLILAIVMIMSCLGTAFAEAPVGANQVMDVRAQGVDLGKQTIGWLYNEALADGTDMFGSGSINDATELFIEDAQDAEKSIVLSLNGTCTKPNQYTIENAGALLYMTYSQGADHSSTEGGFITGTVPWVYADLIFGDVSTPASSTRKSRAAMWPIMSSGRIWPAIRALLGHKQRNECGDTVIIDDTVRCHSGTASATIGQILLFQPESDAPGALALKVNLGFAVKNSSVSSPMNG